VEAFEENLNKRIKDFGRKVKEYNLGNFIHPSFKGGLLKKSGSDAYQTTIEYIKGLFDQGTEEQAGQGSLDMFATEAVATPPTASWTGLNLDELLGEEGPIAQGLRDKTPIEVEVDKWTQMTGIVRDVDVDILAYWKAKSKELPLLGQLAKNILGLQVTSSSSERLFSEAGLVVTAKRQLLATTQCEKLVFIHENHDRLAPFINKWKTDLNEFSEEEEEKEKEKEKDPTPGTSASATVTSHEISLRFRKPSSSSSDPDDPAAMDINLIEELPEAIEVSPHEEADDDEEVEEIEPEMDE
jgi:hypothetical protein